MIPSWHLSDSAVEEFAFSDQSVPRHARHLERCQSCRNRVQFRRRLRTLAGELRGPEIDERLLASLERRIEIGDRVILPLSVTGVTRSKAMRGIAWTALAAAAVLLFTWTRSDLQAGPMAGTLTFAPALVNGADSIVAQYSDAGVFSGAGHLVLRARYRTARNTEFSAGIPHLSVATLRQTTPGIYTATIRVPADVQYAVFAVEDDSARRVDSNNRALWELLRLGSDGQPSEVAMLQRHFDLKGRNPELALVALQRLVRAYPDSPESWARLVHFEYYMLGAAHSDSTMPAHRERLYAFDSVLRAMPRAPLAAALGERDYAAQLSDSAHSRDLEIGRHWTAYVRQHHDSLANRDFLWSDVGTMIRTAPNSALVEAERLWNDGTPHEAESVPAIGNGLYAAVAAGDSAAMLRWTDRLYAKAPDQYFLAYLNLLEKPSVRAAAMERLRPILQRIGGREDMWRPLELTAAADAERKSVLKRRVLLGFADALMSMGRYTAATDTIQRGLSDLWDASLYRKLGQLRLIAGDTSAALEPLAYAVADPNTGPAVEDSLRHELHEQMSSPLWHTLVVRGDSAMRARTLAAATWSRPTANARLQRSDGSSVYLDSLRANRVTVIVYWSSVCGFSRVQLPTTAQLATKLAVRGIGFVLVTKQAPSEQAQLVLPAEHLTLTTVHDSWAELARDVGQYATPEVYVLDAEGRVRFAHGSIADALTQATVLAGRSQLH